MMVTKYVDISVFDVIAVQRSGLVCCSSCVYVRIRKKTHTLCFTGGGKDLYYSGESGPED